MTSIRWAALALVLACSVAAQDKTYEIKFKWKPVAGSKFDETEAESQTVHVVVKAGGQVANENKQAQSKTLTAAVEVLKVEGDKASESKATFSKAVRLVEGKETPFGFQGKTVRMARNKDGSPQFTREDKVELSAEEISALTSFCDDKESKPGEPSAEELLAPKKPVKVGESWTPDTKRLVATMMGELTEALDIEKSKVTLKLVSVETRDGAEFAKVDCQMELLFKQMGPMELEKPLTMKVSGEIQACNDGRRPDGEMKLKMEMKGESPITTPDGVKLSVILDMSGGNSKVIKSSK